MKTLIFFVLCCIKVAAQTSEIHDRMERSLVEAGTYLNFSGEKIRQNPGLYVGYWYRYPVDAGNTHLEIGGNFSYSSSIYDFDYGKKGLFYRVNTQEFIVNFGTRLVKGYSFRNHRIEWVSELSFHNLFFDGRGIPSDQPVENNNKSTWTVDTHLESVASLKLGQGIRFWRKNAGIGIQASYMPYRLWYRNTVPKGFNSFSVEAGVNFKF